MEENFDDEVEVDDGDEENGYADDGEENEEDESFINGEEDESFINEEVEIDDEEDDEDCIVEEDTAYTTKKEKPKKRKKPEKKSEKGEKKTTKSKKTKKDIVVIEDWEEYMETNPSLLDIQEMVEKLNSTNAAIEKQIILSEYPHCIKALLYVNHPFWKYGVTSSNIEDTKKKLLHTYKKLGKRSKDVFHMLDMLKERVVTGHAAISTVLWFINDNKSYKELIYNLIDKNLNIRCNALSINKVYPKLIKMFKVALANKLTEKITEKLDFENTNWYASRKFDGVRTIIYIDENGEIKFYSREGNPFVTLGVIERKLKPLGLTNIIIDCEACELNEDGSENFQKIVGNIKKLSGEIKRPRMYVFDMLTLDEFHATESERTFEERMEGIPDILTEELEPEIVITAQSLIKGEEHLCELSSEAVDKKWEGIMIRKGDSIYEGKRTNNLLKVKKFEREEFMVTGIEKGYIREVINGKDKKIMTMSNIIIDIGGSEVGVGTGFTMEQRDLFFKNPKLIVGKLASIQFQERTMNKNGKKSIRFPSFKGLYDGPVRDI
jgi:DNA ligase-1